MRHWISVGVSLVVGLLAMTAYSSSLAVEDRPGVIKSQIVDAETQRPISGAVVLLDRSYHCDRRYSQDQVMEAVTGSDGQFVIGSIPTELAGCNPADVVSVVAPGYLPTPVYLRGVNPIRPVRFAIERDAYGPGLIREATPFAGSIPYPPFWLDPPPRRSTDVIFPGGRQLGPRYKAAILSARAVPFTPAGPPGAFVTHPGAEFDRVAIAWSGVGVTSTLTVIAQDRRTGSIHNWNMRGLTLQPPIKLPPGFLMGAGLGAQGYPLITRGGEIYFPGRFEASIKNLASPDWVPSAATGFAIVAGAPGHQYVAVDPTGREFVVYTEHRFPMPDKKFEPPMIKSRISVRERLPNVDVAECVMYRLKEAGFGSVNFWAGDPLLYYVGRNPAERSLFFQAWGPPRMEAVRLPAEIQTDQVTACAASREAFYVAMRSGRIHRLDLSWQTKRQPTYPFTTGQTPVITLTRSAELSGPSGPVSFVALATGPVQPDWDSPWEAVYAAAGNDTIYRFSADLKPDQRITLTR